MPINVAVGSAGAGFVSVGFAPTGILAWTTNTATGDYNSIQNNVDVAYYVGHAKPGETYFTGGSVNLASQNNVDVTRVGSVYANQDQSRLITSTAAGATGTIFEIRPSGTGFTISVIASTVIAPRMHYVVFGGDIRCHSIGGVLPPTNAASGYTVSHSGGGFIPTAALTLMSGTHAQNDARSLSIGSRALFRTGPSEKCILIASRDGANTSATAMTEDQVDGLVGHPGSGDMAQLQIIAASQQQTQVQFGRQVAAPFATGWYRILLIGNAAVRQYNQPGSASSYPITPKVVITAAATRAFSGSINSQTLIDWDNRCNISLGAFTASAEVYASMRDRDDRAVSETARSFGTGSFYHEIALASNTTSKQVTNSVFGASMTNTLTVGSEYPNTGWALLLGDLPQLFSGTATGSSNTSATLRKSHRLIGATTGGAVASGSRLGRAIQSSASASGSSSTSATLVYQPRLSGVLVGSSSANGRIGGSAALSGVAGGFGSLTGSTNLLPVLLSGTARAGSIGLAYLGPIALLHGSATGSGFASSTLAFAAALRASSIGSGNAAASRLKQSHPLIGTIAGTSGAATTISRDRLFDGVATALSTASAAMRIGIAMTGVAQGSSRVIADYAYALPYLRPPSVNETPGTINLIANPSLEYDSIGLLGWSGATLSRTQSASWDGRYTAYASVDIGSPQVLTITTQRGLAIPAEQWVCASIAISGNISASMHLTVFHANATSITGDVITIAPMESPRRVYAPCVQTTAIMTHAVITITLDAPLEGNGWAELDAAQVELDLGGQYSPFVSGDTEGGEWSGVIGNSPSIRQPRATT